jgi:hypothetical protein
VLSTAKNVEAPEPTPSDERLDSKSENSQPKQEIRKREISPERMELIRRANEIFKRQDEEDDNYYGTMDLEVLSIRSFAC